LITLWHWVVASTGLELEHAAAGAWPEILGSHRVDCCLIDRDELRFPGALSDSPPWTLASDAHDRVTRGVANLVP
jgi:hypothetical protein